MKLFVLNKNDLTKKMVYPYKYTDLGKIPSVGNSSAEF